ncbi:hypothetical protein OPQ81_000619 [Rhizoctonia solani]|nr:hypothetical protein OPQ81_000619 [Rhizoctonia solani]
MSGVPVMNGANHTDPIYRLIDLPSGLTNLGVSYSHLFRPDDLKKAIEYLSIALALTPDGHSDLSYRLMHLGQSYNFRFQRLGKLADLKKAIECFSRAVTLTPDGHPRLPSRLMSLGASYGTRFARLGELGDLENAIQFHTLALSLTPNGHPDLSSRLMNLGVSCRNRFERLWELVDVEKAIECHSRALICTPDGDPHLSSHLKNLGVSYGYRFERLGELADLDKAIETISHTLTLTPDGHSDIPSILIGLGVFYINRFKRLGEPADIEKAIECESRVLTLTPDGDPDLPSHLKNLGASYNHRFERLGKIADLEKAIEFQSRALKLTPDGHPDMPLILIGLGMLYSNRFKHLGEQADIKKAIEYESRALTLTPDGDPDLPSRAMNLGVSYNYRFELLGKLCDLEKGIEYLSRALSLTPDGHSDLPHMLTNLGLSYRNRFQRLGKLADLEKSIEYESRALKLTPDGRPGLPYMFTSLGRSYKNRFQHLGELADLEKAIECHSHALALTPNGRPDLPPRLMNLALCYSNRFERLEELADLDKAIEYHSRALTLTPDGHPDFPSMLSNLGRSYGFRFESLGKLTDLEKSIEFQSRAVKLIPNGHHDLPAGLLSLGISYQARFHRLGELHDVEDAAKYLLRGLELTPNGHPGVPRYHGALAQCRFAQFQHTLDPSLLRDSLHFFRQASQSPFGVPKFKYLVALDWAKLTSKFSPSNCIEAYQTAIDLLPQVVWLGSTTHQRYQDLDLAKNLAGSAASAAIRLSQYGLALEWLEHARCVVWRQSLMLRSPLDELHSSHRSLAARLQIVAYKLHQAGSESRASRELSSNLITPEQAAQQHHRLAEEYNDLLTKVRELPGFKDFLRPMKSNGLVRAARYGPIVVINCHEDHCDALVILSEHNGVKHIPLPDFTMEKVQYARTKMEISIRNRVIEARGQRRPVVEQEDHFGDMLTILWYGIVKPVLDSLGYTDKASRGHLPHITWCPTGVVSFLPSLHAAGDYDRLGSRVFDYVISSYTPTLTALIASTPSTLDHSSRVVAIGQKATPGCSPLPGTTLELARVQAHVQNIAQYSQLGDSQATTKAVLDAIEQHDWVHLACHAHQNVEDATQSGFFLHDGILDLAAINRRTFNKKGLAYLSACQTAKGDKKLPDEAVHLASGMLMAGYSSVIATMWSVHDEDAPLVADKVYAQLMKDKTLGNGEAGRALHNAVAELRGKIGEREYTRWVPYIHVGS